MRFIALLLPLFVGILSWSSAKAQEPVLEFLTIERPPFAFLDDDVPTGFSIELMHKIAEGLGREVNFTFVDEFPDMLDAVIAGEVDGAVSNISITSAREAEMDFSRPIYASGLKIMVSGQNTRLSVWHVLFRWEILTLVLAAFGVIFLLGMLMWAVERKKQSYFDHGPVDAMFPSFWWALNLVLNGGFEVNVPKSVLGRMLGVLMVVSSLFIVSIFVANITAAMTLEAITGSIQSLDDLVGRVVGTTNGSTASAFLDEQNIDHFKFANYRDLINAFRHQDLDAVVFDGPILAHFLTQEYRMDAELLDRVFRPEDYGIALFQGSELREPINRVLLRLMENGEYEALARQYFGESN